MSDNTNHEGRSTVSRRAFLAGAAAGTALSLSATTAGAQAELCAQEDVDCGVVATGADGMVVSVSPEASEVGARVLREGGNAVDAAVAIQFALTVTQPHSSGIGGGGFMLYYDNATDEVEVVNSRERGAGGATPHTFLA
jgi:gamma-glutamyltranspeptidase / glutathione hydrolase